MRLLTIIGLVAMVALAAVGIAAVQEAPLEPGAARGLVRVDGLSALFGLVVPALTLARLASGREREPLRALAAAALLAAAFQTTHLALLAAGLLAAALAALPIGRGWTGPPPLSPAPAAQERGSARGRQVAWHIAGPLLALCSGAGLAWVALQAGTWRYPVPAAGQGLNSLSFGLILLAAVGAGLGSQKSEVRSQESAPSALSSQPSAPLLAVGLLYPLYRLFSLGPWNLGWQLAALLLGAGVCLWGAWGAATAEAGARVEGRLSTHLLGLAIIGAGLSAGAGVALGGYALLSLVVWQLWPAEAGVHPLRWLVCGAVPLTAPFVTAWISVAAALAAGSSLLAMALWAGALLAAVPIARGSQKSEVRSQKSAGAVEPLSLPDDTPQGLPGSRLTSDFPLLPSRLSLLAAPLLSIALGIASPLVLGWLLEPAVAQLQGGLTPFGEVRLWPWAGLLAFNASRQPVATLPSVALGALMLILAALVWAVTRLLSLRREREREAQDG